jgi:hypothetical protein
MFGSHWYIDGAPGVRFCWLKEPTYVCRYAPGVADFRTVEDRLREAAPELADVAGGLGIEIGRVMNRAHSGGRGGRRRVNDKLTDRCDACGAKMRRLGFRAWREELKAPDETTEGERARAAIGEAFGGDGLAWRTTESHYMGTKREAEAWARENVAVSRAAVA